MHTEEKNSPGLAGVNSGWSPLVELGGSPPSVIFVVATMLGGVGHTGVETHFREILQEFKGAGVPTQLVTPYTGSRWKRILARPLKNVTSEWAVVAYRRAQAWFLERQLTAIGVRNPASRIVVYAQCPISASAALRARRQHAGWKTALVIHYNQSEKAEVIEKGLAKISGPWVRHLDTVERLTLPMVDQIFFVSDFMRQILERRISFRSGVEKITLHNFPPRPTEESLTSFEGDLIAIGTLEPRKNQIFLLKVLAAAKRNGKIFRLGIVGDGPDRFTLEKIAFDLGVSDQINFLGFQSNAARLILRYRAFIHAATLENCPISVLEALSYARPVFAPRVGGIPELFSDNVEGRFWNLDDPSGAAVLLADVLSSPARYDSMCSAAADNYRTRIRPLSARWTASLLAETKSARDA